MEDKPGLSVFMPEEGKFPLFVRAEETPHLHKKESSSKNENDKGPCVTGSQGVVDSSGSQTSGCVRITWRIY